MIRRRGKRKTRDRWYLYVDGKRVTTLYKKRQIGEIINTRSATYNAKIYNIIGKCLMATTNY